MSGLEAAISAGAAQNQAGGESPHQVPLIDPGTSSSPELGQAGQAVPPGPSARALMFRGYLRMGGDLAAEKTKFEGWALADAEALQIAVDLDDVIKKYFPQLGEGEMPPEFRLALSLGGALAFRWYMFNRWKAEQEKQKAEEARKAAEKKP